MECAHAVECAIDLVENRVHRIIKVSLPELHLYVTHTNTLMN